MRTQPRVVLAALALALLAPGPARAQLLFTITPGTRTGAPGDTLTYTGTLTNQSAVDTLFLTSGAGTVDNPEITVDELSFLGYTPPSLAPNASYSGNLFDVNIGTGSSTGDYPGSFEILYGLAEGATNLAARQDFTVAVVTPAPPAALVFAFGGVGALIARRRRKGC